MSTKVFFSLGSVFIIVFFVSGGTTPLLAETLENISTKEAVKKQIPEELIRQKKETTEQMNKERLEFKSQMQKQRSEFQESIKLKREEAKQTFKTQKEEFKQKVDAINDERKQAVVEKIDTKLSSINDRRTTQMSEVLDKLSTILDEFEKKTQDEGTGASLTTAITTARNAIASAEAAVTTQASKEYVISITTETNLKTTVGQTIAQFQTDLQAVHKAVVSAKQAVMNVRMELAKNRINKVTITQSP